MSEPSGIFNMTGEAPLIASRLWASAESFEHFKRLLVENDICCEVFADDGGAVVEVNWESASGDPYMALFRETSFG